MTTYTLTGTIDDLVGAVLTSPTGAPARAYLMPYTPAVIEGATVRVGGLELAVTSGVFTQAGVPAGVYALRVRYYDEPARQMRDWTSNYFVVSSSADVSALITTPVFPDGTDGDLIVPVTSANSGTAYTVTAPTHNERRLKLTLTGNATLTCSGGTTGEVCAVQLHLIQDATGSRTVTWPGNVDWGVAGAPVLSTTAGKIDMVYLTTDDGGSSWQGALVGNGY